MMLKASLLLVLVFANVSARAEILSCSFGNSVFSNDTFECIISRKLGRVCRINDSIYPLSFPDGATITFTAASNSPVDVRFRLEYQPYPNVDPAFNTSSVTVNGATETTYAIAVPSQGNNTYSY